MDTWISPVKRATGGARQMQRNGARAKMVGAGRMTATARTDIGAVKPDCEAWVRGLRTDV
jgi:hypothetical protein